MYQKDIFCTFMSSKMKKLVNNLKYLYFILKYELLDFYGFFKFETNFFEIELE